jgi:hypothetical protein
MNFKSKYFKYKQKNLNLKNMSINQVGDTYLPPNFFFYNKNLSYYKKIEIYTNNNGYN